MKYIATYHIDGTININELFGDLKYNYDDNIYIISKKNGETQEIELSDVTNVTIESYKGDYTTELISKEEIYPFDGCNSPWAIAEEYDNKFKYNRKSLNPMEREILYYCEMTQGALKLLNNTVEQVKIFKDQGKENIQRILEDRKIRIITNIENSNEIILKLKHLNDLYNKVYECDIEDGIILANGLSGKYGKKDKVHKNCDIRYYLPSGKYKIIGIGYQNNFDIETIELINNHPKIVKEIELTQDEIIERIEINDGECIRLYGTDKIEIVKL